MFPFFNPGSKKQKKIHRSGHCHEDILLEYKPQDHNWSSPRLSTCKIGYNPTCTFYFNHLVAPDITNLDCFIQVKHCWGWLCPSTSFQNMSNTTKEIYIQYLLCNKENSFLASYSPHETRKIIILKSNPFDIYMYNIWPIMYIHIHPGYH